MAQEPVAPLQIIQEFGPHRAYMHGVQLDTGAEADRLVKTHCCFCGQQCGIQLKVKDTPGGGGEVIGFEPWEEFPFNRGMLCPKGVKRYLQGAHPDRLLNALRRDPNAADGSGFSAMRRPAARSLSFQLTGLRLKCCSSARSYCGGRVAPP